VCVAADARHARHAEIKRSRGEAGRLKERHDETTEAAVDVQSNAVLLCQCAERDDIVLTAVGKVDSRADELYVRAVS
jgi:ferredoxin